MFQEVEAITLQEIKIGTRGSILALAQSKIIADKISQSWPDLQVKIITITTQGDTNMTAFTSSAPGIKGLFTQEIEQALSNHEIDFAVHSLKDLPVQENLNLPIIAYSKRGDPRDALILNEDSCTKILASSSLRRRLQLEKLYPDSKIIPVRGNINTRIKKLDNEKIFSGLVLAASGLERLNLTDRITKIFSVNEIMPAPGQGVIACQGVRGRNYNYLECVNDKDSQDCSLAERSFARALNAGCNVPAGAYAEIHDNILTLRGLYIDNNKIFHSGTLSGLRSEAAIIGENLAREILS
ncbi:MAG: hydroxymethylbilane synthase [Synergistaceae bacterium]|nr:hydroxymethylbilane synthase [Synergistaceae bacterium]